MSLELLAQAASHPAFDPTPIPASLAACHVPFELLQSDDLETGIAERLRDYGRIALVGPPGCGKSSVARYVMALKGDGLAPIWIDVASEGDRIAGTRGFLEILISQLVRHAQRAGRLQPDERRRLLTSSTPIDQLPSEERTTKLQLGGDVWLLKGEIANEVTRIVRGADAYRTTDEFRSAARDVLALIAASELVPVLVADDTDRILRVAGDEEALERRFNGFFGEVVREIAEQLECGLLIAVHDDYVTRAGYREMTDGMFESVRIPAITQEEHVGAIITSRASFSMTTRRGAACSRRRL